MEQKALIIGLSLNLSMFRKTTDSHTPLIDVAPWDRTVIHSYPDTQLNILSRDKDVHPEPLGNLGFDMNLIGRQGMDTFPRLPGPAQIA